MDDRSRIQEVLARYVRATDARDGAGQGALFTDDAVVRIFSKTVEGAHAEVGKPLIGGTGVEFAVTNFMAPHPALGSSHHGLQDLPFALPDAGPAPSGRA